MTHEEPTPEERALERGDPTQMRGPIKVRHDIAEFLREWLPAHLAAFREVYELTEAQLPLPASHPGEPRKDAYFPREALAIDRWPMVSVQTGRRTVRAVDFTLDGDPQFIVTYPVRVFSWIKAIGHDAAVDMRDDFATAVLQTFASHVGLSDPDRYEVVVSSLLVDPSAVTSVTGEGFVAGSFVGFNLNSTETLTDALAMPQHPVRDTVLTVNVATIPLEDQA